MKDTGAKRNVCPGSCVSTGAKFPVAPVESAPMPSGVSMSTPLEGVDIETPKASMGWGGKWEGCVPLPSRLGDLWSVVSYPSGVRGFSSQARNY